MLLLHGGGLDYAGLSYQFTISPLSEKHTVFAPDWPGYGESEKPDASYTTEYFTEFLSRLLDILGLEKTSLVGISMGGAIALAFTLQFPERVDKLILVDSYGLCDRVPRQPLAYVALRVPALSNLIWKSLRSSGTVIGWALRKLVYDPRIISDRVLEDVKRILSTPGIEKAFTSWLRTEIGWKGLRTNLINRLHEIKVPTLILHGSDDRSVPPHWAHQAHKLIRNSKLHIFSKCGHWPPREKVDEFNSKVLEFLAGV